MNEVGAAPRRGRVGHSPPPNPRHAAMLLRPVYPEITELEAAAYALGVDGRPASEVEYPENEDLWRDAGIELAYILGLDGDRS